MVELCSIGLIALREAIRLMLMLYGEARKYFAGLGIPVSENAIIRAWSNRK
jgi:hypothetical protein